MEMDNSISVPEETALTQTTVVPDDAMHHQLHDKWTLWAHLPHDTDWTVKSYKKIMTFSTIEEAIVLYETIPDKMVKNCMLFLMRDGIKPTWEDEKNCDGGCFSYKVGNKNVTTTWKHASYLLIGESLTSESKLGASINGITISPKKNFCIIKIWLDSCEFQNPRKIMEIAGIVPDGCLFKKHVPQY